MYYKEDKINYDRLIIFGLLVTLLIFVGISVYWSQENGRLAHAKELIGEERIHRGEAIYIAQCAACHGGEGEGGVGPALNNKGLLKNTVDNIIISVVKSGVPSTKMPAWSIDFGGPLTDEDVKDVVAFIRAWEPTAPEIVLASTEPDASRGALLFASTCAICHGENGTGGDAPAINDMDKLSKLKNVWYESTIKNGRPAKGMPTWGTVLSPGQTADLLALVDAWRNGEQVAAEFSITKLLELAAFSLSEGDGESAQLQLDRALKISNGIANEILTNAELQLSQDDLEGALATVSALQDQWPMGDPTIGAESFAKYCAPCHGVTGDGGVGPALKMNEFIQSMNNAGLVEMINQGRTGTAMAGFSTRLTEDEVANIVSFLRLWQP